mmetsp:Transcript_3860/g.7716  ORF Transcript_3860/g.7716 Transcript_3860/m.7716 type:complete len:515 (+) Transcript_3860:62-1606(+)
MRLRGCQEHRWGGNRCRSRFVWVLLAACSASISLHLRFCYPFKQGHLALSNPGAAIVEGLPAVTPRLRHTQQGAAGSNDDSSQPAPPKVRDAASIFAGTAIGGGSLALPTVVAPMGLAPAMLGLIIASVFVTVTSLAYGEVALAVTASRQEDDDSTAVSVVTIVFDVLGRSAAVACSVAFVTQMLVIQTAQVIKAGEILGFLFGMPYQFCCFTTALLLGVFSHVASFSVVERGNTALTATLVTGFLMLLVSISMTISHFSWGQLISRLSFADWRYLSPTASTWAIPVFVQMLMSGPAVPIVVGRLGLNRPKGIYSAITIGALIPLLICISWSAVSLAVTAFGGTCAVPDVADPVLQMLSCSPDVAIPVALVAIGAIGTTIVPCNLCLGQFVSDAICTALGVSDASDMGDKSILVRRLSKIVTVLIPICLACGGPKLFVPLLAFNGSCPTTLLYGLMPPVAALTLRGVLGRARDRVPQPGTQKRRLVPGGTPVLGLCTLAAVAMLVVSAGRILMR